jgi:C1A family cysteine protease
VDFGDDEVHETTDEKNKVQFELNKFSDLSEKEFEQIYLIDQTYFDENLHPPIFENTLSDLDLGLSNIIDYLHQTIEKQLDKNSELTKILSELSEDNFSFANNLEPSGLNMTPHLSSTPSLLNGESLWTEFVNNDTFQTDSENFHSQFFSNQRILQKRRKRNHKKIPSHVKYISIDGVRVPTKLNWKKMRAITPIKDQFKCNSCYAFAGLAAIESHHKIQTGESVNLSEQEIVDCSYENKGCTGGLPHYVYRYVINSGISFTKHYPYIRSEGYYCKRRNYTHKFQNRKFVSYTNLPEGVLPLIKTLTKGPIAVISYASFRFKQYAGGIYNGQGCYGKKKPNHASLLIGYSLTGRTMYLHFKNGWGTDFGERGYYKVKLESLHPSYKAHCLIGSRRYNSIPVIRK